LIGNRSVSEDDVGVTVVVTVGVTVGFALGDAAGLVVVVSTVSIEFCIVDWMIVVSSDPLGVVSGLISGDSETY